MCSETSGILRGLLGMDETVQEPHEWRQGVDEMVYSLASVRDTWHFLGAEAELPERGAQMQEALQRSTSR